MKVIQKSLRLRSDEFYEQHLNIVNAVLPSKLTNKEVKVLSAFMSADPKLTEEDMFNSIVRKEVMSKLGLSSGGLGNYLNSMIKKGFLDKNKITNRITVKEFLMCEESGQGYQFKIIKLT